MYFIKKLFFILFSIISSACFAYDWNKYCWHNFEGKIGNAEIQLSFFITDSNKVIGNYYYNKYGEKIDLRGFVNGSKIELIEYIDKKENGFFYGGIDNSDNINGIWEDKLRDKKLILFLDLVSITPSSSITNRYSNLYGTTEEVENFMKKIKSSIIKEDRNWIANNTRFPIKVSINGKNIIIKNKTQLIYNFDKIFYPEFRERIKVSRHYNLFFRNEGVMLGNGEIWISNSKNSTDKKYGFSIITINN